MSEQDAWTPGSEIRVGVNYVPASGWFYSWLDLDLEDVRRDLADIASLGLDHIRIFPIWPWIQPNRGHIRQRAIADVLAVIDLAAEFGLDVSVDLIQGHLSSFDFLPSWMLTWHRASLFTDQVMREGLSEYVEVMAGQIGSRPNVFAITLGNEVNNLWPASETSPAAARQWAAELLDAVRVNAPCTLAVHSLYDDAWYAPSHPFHAIDAVDLGDVTSVHSWVFNGVSGIDGPLGFATLSHADYLVELAAAAAISPDRPVWLQEIGAPQPDIPAPMAADFVIGALDLVCTNPALWGVTWWCSHDIDPALRDFPPREYGLGLFSCDHRVKPAGRALAAAAAGLRGRAATGDGSERRTLSCPRGLREDPNARSLFAPGSDFHAEWVRSRRDAPTTIVRPESEESLAVDRCGPVTSARDYRADESWLRR